MERSKTVRVYYIDAFASELFKGNPAAVCLLDEALSEPQMQAIAEQIGFSETCFVLACGKSHFTLRWFTPEIEVDLCGHGTLATAFILWQLNKEHEVKDTLYFHTKSGILPVYKENDYIVLDFPLLPVTKSDKIYSGLLESLGLPQSELFESEISKYLLIETTKERLQSLNIDFYKLKQIPIHPFTSVIITSQGDDNYDFYSRCFAAWEGINEDPVTGSAHCVLASYWQSYFPQKNNFKAFQASKRGGEIIINIKNDRTLLKGKAVLFMKGKIFL